jgi:hypothetical protein
MIPEIAYLGHDNLIDLILKADGVAVDLSSVTAMTLTLGTKKVSSTNLAADPILWAKAGYATGEVHLILGGETITPGNYDAPLVVYDPVESEGVVWGNVKITVKAEVEGTV